MNLRVASLTLDSTRNATHFHRTLGFQGDTASIFQSLRGISLECMTRTNSVAETRLATEAVMKLTSTAYDLGASEVAAETYPSLIASLRVMEKSGMIFIGDGADPGTVRYSINKRQRKGAGSAALTACLAGTSSITIRMRRFTHQFASAG
jgi:hypothetical protein